MFLHHSEFSMINYLQRKNEFEDANITASDCLNILTPEQKLLIEKNTTLLEFKKGETIIKQGFVASHILYIESGLAKLDVTDDKKTSTVKLLSSGSFVGIICTFACKSIDFSSVALEDTTVEMINIEVFKKLITENGEFAMMLIQHMSALTNNMVHWITRISSKNIEGALALMLSELAIIYKSNSFKIPVTRKVLAEMVGYSKESVINTLSKFNKEGIIKLDEKNIELIDIEKLKLIERTS